MNFSSSGLDLLKRSEGFRDRVYVDVAGFRTIGFGHRLAANEQYPQGITPAQADSILSADLAIAESAVRRLVHVPLNQGQFDALVDFVFNLGAGRLAASTLLRNLNAGKYETAAWQLLSWDHAGNQELASLKLRREAEFHLWSPTFSPAHA
ncbi:MAG TPA: lysozyme [Terracidiphilus sp.]|jgi:lysozyme